VAAREWDRAVAAMPPGLYTAADVPALAVYADAWANYLEARDLVARDGLIVRGGQGQPAAHPALAVQARQAEIILKAGDRLGMTPAARTRLTLPDAPEPGKFGSLLGGAPLKVVTSNERNGSARSSSN
jgi:P27 family predicted phage terminase small subunit